MVECHGSGSPMYLAPETILERPISSAVDIWACGVILFLLLVRILTAYKVTMSAIFGNTLRSYQSHLLNENLKIMAQFCSRTLWYYNEPSLVYTLSSNRGQLGAERDHI